MSKSEYKFVSTDTESIVADMISAYEAITNHTVRPASPEMLFIRWVADMLLQIRALINHAANQNLPSRASGQNLDYLGELFYDSTRPDAESATCRMVVNISEAQASAILIPRGTRFTDADSVLFWDSADDVYIPAGETSAEIQLICETPGTVGNGYLPGQINTLVDISDILYYSSCANITASDGGAAVATDEEYYELMRASEDAYSVAGPMGAYVYWAKSVSTQIADVKAVRPRLKVGKALNVYAGHAFMGGEHLFLDSLKVYLPGGGEAVPGADYSVSYADNLMDIAIVSAGKLDGLAEIEVSITEEMAGHVHIYVLMENGNIASETIKELVCAACNDESVRPLTDYVSVQDPSTVPYDIDVTYYIQRDVSVPATDIEAAVKASVEQYISWQGAKLGRDINPSKLHDLMMNTGIKRTEIRQPMFQHLSNGSDGTAPRIATVANINIVNGGYEDE